MRNKTISHMDLLVFFIVGIVMGIVLGICCCQISHRLLDTTVPDTIKIESVLSKPIATK